MVQLMAKFTTRVIVVRGTSQNLACHTQVSRPIACTRESQFSGLRTGVFHVRISLSS